jgi:hypothetical protein
MYMSIDVDTPIRREFKDFSFDQFTLYERELGKFGVRVYTPNIRQIDALEREPELNVAYGPGWAQGVDATNEIARMFAKEGHMRFASIKLPEGTHDISGMVPFHTDVLRAGTELMLAEYVGPLVIESYSRGSMPATIVAHELSSDIAGVQYVEPTWFENEHTPLSLAARGVGEGIGSLLRRDSFSDKLDLLHMGAHALKEAIHRPLELRRDVSAIADEARPTDLIERLARVRTLGVVVGRFDGICRRQEVLSVAQEIADSDPGREVDILEVDIGHFNPFKNRRSRAEIIDQLYRLAS